MLIIYIRYIFIGKHCTGTRVGQGWAGPRWGAGLGAGPCGREDGSEGKGAGGAG